MQPESSRQSAINCEPGSYDIHNPAMDKIEITSDGTVRPFYVAPHFYDRLEERSTTIGLRQSLLNAIYIEKRPNAIAMMIKHNNRAFYLWDDNNKLVYVIEECLQTKKVNILKTVYTSLGCQWLLEWQSTHPKVGRKRFREVFHDDQIFR